MSNAIILCTALLPTIGHKYLIDFAKNLVSGNKVTVIICSRSFEPIEGYARISSFEKTFSKELSKFTTVNFHLHEDDNVPQEPADHPDFWNIWSSIVKDIVDVKPDDYFVASETYGIKMAEVLGCKFVPCNIYREILPVKGSEVRKNILDNFEYVLSEFQPDLIKTVTLFGAESCGKTTMAKRLAKDLNGWFVPEWAREYLEVCGTEITDQKMLTIFDAQFASQRTVKNTFRGKPWVFQDTDLLSTIGYYKLYNENYKQFFLPLDYIEKYKLTKSNLYVVMNDQIPFEQDPIRYGGTVRESNSQFWINLLKEYKCQYIEVPVMSHDDQANWLKRRLINWFNDSTSDIVNFKR
jgi:NadR type nicotinamide-nucleotide adenylyltransferase